MGKRRPPDLTRYSPTKLATYLRCPRQYQFQYVAKIPRAPTAAMTFGATLHRVLEKPGATAEDTIRRLEAQWTTLPDQDAQWRHTAERIVQSFHQVADEGIPILTEKRLMAPFDGIQLWGIIDRVDLLPSGGLEIIDYKSTAHIARDPVDLPPETWLQLTIYHYLVFQHLPRPIEKWSVHYLRTQQRLSFLPEETDIQRRLQDAAATARAIESDTAHQPRLGPHCAWCPYLRRCPAH